MNSRSPIEYVLHNVVSDKILIPARNLYGTKLPKRIQLTHTETNESIELQDTLVGGRYKYLARGWGDSFNFLWLQMHEVTKIRPGNYRLELIDGDGSKIKFPEPILIKVGPINIEAWEPGQGPEVKPGGLLTVHGRNLFSKGLLIDLIDSLDNITKLADAEFDIYGNQVSINIPSSIKYRHYVLSVHQDDGFNKLQLCGRLYIKSRAIRPFEIVALGEGLCSCSIKGPVRIPKNKWVGILANGVDAKIRLRLEPLGQSSEQYWAEAFLYSYSSPQGEPSARIPNNVPTGSYHVFLQVLNAENKVLLETPRFWRVIEVY